METASYRSYTDVFVASTSDDLTGSISPGMRLRMSQSTGGTKYFIVVAISGSDITLYGGTDYTLNNETISDPVFSSAKAPFGFPLNPAKWTVTLSDTTNRSQSNPTNGTWYNLGSLSLDIPFGVWDTYYELSLYANKSSASILDSSATLSTSNNSESNVDFTAKYVVQDLVTHTVTAFKRFLLSPTSKTTYYLLARSAQASITLLAFTGAQEIPTKVYAVCAYL